MTTTNFTEKLTNEDGVCIYNPKKAEKFLYHHTGVYEDIVLAAHYIHKEFGKNIQLELRIEKTWHTGPDQAILITRLHEYPEDIIDRLDRISDDILHLYDDDHGGWLLLTTDFRLLVGLWGPIYD